MSKQKIINFGSLNIDHVYKVHDFVSPGQTINCLNYEIHPGGKGLNQSIALARAGILTYHFGKLASNDIWLKELLIDNQINTQFLDLTGSVTGHAIIQVNQQAENCIIIHAGANRELRIEEIKKALELTGVNACLVQNEINLVPEIIHMAKEKNIPAFFNPAPYSNEIKDFPLSSLECLILNETEAFEFCKTDSIQQALNYLLKEYPQLKIVLTLGSKGAIYKDQNNQLVQTGFTVKAVDTTAAGDTFIGFFIAEFLESKDPAKALKLACQAAALAVTRKGAATSVPTLLEVTENFKNP